MYRGVMLTECKGHFVYTKDLVVSTDELNIAVNYSELSL